MLRPEVVEWIKNPRLSETDVWVLCFSPRGCLIGLAVHGFTFEEQVAIAIALYKKYGREMDPVRRGYLRREVLARGRLLRRSAA